MMRSCAALLAALGCAGIGNVLLRKGMLAAGALESWAPDAVLHFFASALGNPYVITGLGLEAAYFMLWLIVLSWSEASWAAPMHAVEYAWVGILAVFFLGEHVGAQRWGAIALITVGVALLMSSWEAPAYAAGTGAAQPSSTQRM